MRGATCAGTQTSKAPTLSGPSVSNHYSVAVAYQPDNFNPAIQISDYYHYLSLQKLIIFTVKELENICMAGLKLRTSYSTDCQ